MTQQNPEKLENEGIIKTVIILSSVALMLVIGAPYSGVKKNQNQLSPNKVRQVQLVPEAGVKPATAFEP